MRKLMSAFRSAPNTTPRGGYVGHGIFATFCGPGMKSDYECKAEVSGPDLGAIPQFATTTDGNGQAAHEGVLLATAGHSTTLRVVSEHQECE
jgi:hypothetical protein